MRQDCIDITTARVTGSRIRLPMSIPVEASTRKAFLTSVLNLYSHRNLKHENQHTHAGTAPQDGRLLACRQLSVGRPDFSIRQSVDEAAAHAYGREAHAAG